MTPPSKTFALDVVHARDESNIARLLSALEGLDAVYRTRPNTRHLASAGPEPDHTPRPARFARNDRPQPRLRGSAIAFGRNGRRWRDPCQSTRSGDTDPNQGGVK